MRRYNIEYTEIADRHLNIIGVTQFHLSTERSIYIRNGINIRGPFSADL